MTVLIKCPHCPELAPFKIWHEYAKHILKEHLDDEERCTWARNSLADTKMTNATQQAAAIVQEEKSKFKGKPVDKIPVARRDKLPAIVKATLEQEDNKLRGDANEPQSEETRKEKTKRKSKAKAKPSGKVQKKS